MMQGQKLVTGFPYVLQWIRFINKANILMTSLFSESFISFLLFSSVILINSYKFIILINFNILREDTK